MIFHNQEHESNTAKYSLLWIIIICWYLKLDSGFHFASETTALTVFFLKVIKHQQLKALLQDSCDELLAELVLCSSTGTLNSKGGWQLHFSVRTLLNFGVYLNKKCRKKGCSPLVEGTSNGLTTCWCLYGASLLLFWIKVYLTQLHLEHQ